MDFHTAGNLLAKAKGLKVLLPPPLREILSEADGSGSYSRTTGFIIIMTVLALLVFIVVKTHAFPDMTGPTVFITGGAGTGYGINQIKNIVAAAKSGIAVGTSSPAQPTGAPPDASKS